jgi:hypothetical protein
MGDVRGAEAELARAVSTARHQGAEALITRAAEVQNHLVPN